MRSLQLPPPPPRPNQEGWLEAGRRIFGPLAHLVQTAWRGLPYGVLALTLAYLSSGISTIEAGETGLVFRGGRLLGGETAAAQHPPGLLLSLPPPFDRVHRVPTGQVFETRVNDLQFDLGSADRKTRFLVTNQATLDPEVAGYALTGDHNIIHCGLIARYQIRDPAAWATASADPEGELRTLLLTEAVRLVGASPVDQLLAEGRKTFVTRLQQATQTRLDRIDSPLVLVHLELEDLGPPAQVREAFSSVQSAEITAETRRKEAGAYRETVLPKARSEAEERRTQAQARAQALRQEATAGAAAFRALAASHARSPRVVRERLYREGVEAALEGVKDLRFVPPGRPMRLELRPQQDPQ